jgi:hypothetical protein
MTYWFLLNPMHWTKGSERGSGMKELVMPVPAEYIRPAFLQLFRQYGLLDAVTTMDQQAFREHLRDVLPLSAIDFQLKGSSARTAKAVTKYARILGKEVDADQMRPTRLVAPYVPIGIDGERDALLQGAMNERARRYAPATTPLWTVLAVSGTQSMGELSADRRDALRLQGFDGVGLWVGSLDEHAASAIQLRRYRDLVRSLRKPVWLMYAGYFGLLMGWDGVAEISHGVFYTESKKLIGPVGSGPPADRYYIRRLHRFFEPVRAFAILDELPELQCDCPECGDLEELRNGALQVRKSPSHRAEWVGRLQRHFLHCRRSEIEWLSTSGRQEALLELRATIDMVQAVRDPVRRALRLSADHLKNWLSAMTD